MKDKKMNERVLAMTRSDDWLVWMEEKICESVEDIGLNDIGGLNTAKKIDERVDHMVENWLFDMDDPNAISRKDVMDVLQKMAPLFKAFAHALERNISRSQTIQVLELDHFDKSKITDEMKYK